MNNRVKDVIWLIAVALIFTAMTACIKRCESRQKSPQTTVRIDTVFIHSPSAKDSLPIRTDTIYYKVPVVVSKTETRYIHTVDTLVKVDTVNHTVSLPITQKTYRDSNYTAVVSGYSPNLDYIETYNKTVTHTVTKWRQPRFSVGAGVGYYLTPKGLQPGIGITLQYNIINIK